MGRRRCRCSYQFVRFIKTNITFWACFDDKKEEEYIEKDVEAEEYVEEEYVEAVEESVAEAEALPICFRLCVNVFYRTLALFSYIYFFPT